MVDALRAVHDGLRPRGLVVDVRPDVTRHARILARGRVRALMRRSADACHAQADAAVERVVARGRFDRVRRGLIWYSSRFRDLAELDGYLRNGGRSGDDEWRHQIGAYRRDPLTLRRASKFDVLVRL